MLEPSSSLLREPAVRPRVTRFENSAATVQQQLFSPGVGELPGQGLMFDPLSLS
jgi:hypothetical protein